MVLFELDENDDLVVVFQGVEPPDDRFYLGAHLRECIRKLGYDSPKATGDLFRLGSAVT